MRGTVLLLEKTRKGCRGSAIHLEVWLAITVESTDTVEDVEDGIYSGKG